MLKTEELKNNPLLQAEFTQIINNYLGDNSERQALELVNDMRRDLGIELRYIGYGSTSFVIGDENIAIKIYRKNQPRNYSNLCNDLILREMLDLNFIPKFIGGVENKFVITEFIKYDKFSIHNLSLYDINEIFKQVLTLHLKGICVNDLHNDNIVWSEDKQKFVFIDVGAFSKEGYIDYRTDFKIIPKDKINNVPLLRFLTSSMPFAVVLWTILYVPLIRKADLGLIDYSTFDINSINDSFSQFEQEYCVKG